MKSEEHIAELEAAETDKLDQMLGRLRRDVALLGKEALEKLLEFYSAPRTDEEIRKRFERTKSRDKSTEYLRHSFEVMRAIIEEELEKRHNLKVN